MTDNNPVGESKLLKLKKWLTIPETAKQLSIMVGEEVTEADILRFGLDRHLTLSLYLVNGTPALRGGRFLPYDQWEAKFRETANWDNVRTRALKNGMIDISFPGYDYSFHFNGEGGEEDDAFFPLLHDKKILKQFLCKLSDEKKDQIMDSMIKGILDCGKSRSKDFDGSVPPSICSFKDEVSNIFGLFDLTMLGIEVLSIENRYQVLTDGPSVTRTCFEGPIVVAESGYMYRIQEMYPDEMIESMKEERKKKKAPNYKYLERLNALVAAGRIDADEAERLFGRHKENRNKPMSYSDLFYPASSLPKDGVLVVRTTALRKFLNRLLSEEIMDDNHGNTPILDSSHPFHAKGLKIGCEAWTELYEKNPPQQVPPGGHKKYICTWLEENYPDLTERAKDRIATVINPNPKGGASPII